MADTHRAPRQWPLTRKETVNTFENWKQNLLYTLQLDKNFTELCREGQTWGKKSKHIPNRDFKDDNSESDDAKTAIEKAAILEMMLGQIANYCPVISRKSILNCTSLPQIWQIIRLHYGFQSSGAHFIDLADINLQCDESPEDLYQRLMAFTEDNLLRTDGNITHHGDAPEEDEEMSPTLENFIVLRWLMLIHPDLPRIVKQRYGTELRSRTLASIRPEISQAIPSLLDELRGNVDARATRTSTEYMHKRRSSSRQYSQRYTPRRNEKRKSCPICAASKKNDDHWLSECRFLPPADKQFMARARQISDIIDATTQEDETDSEDESAPNTTRRVSVRQSPYITAFCQYHPVDIIIDTGATGNMIREDTAQRLNANITKSTQSASQADGTSRLKVTGETRLRFTRGPLTFDFEGLVVKDLDVEVLAGIPFMEQNDLSVRPAHQRITFADDTSCSYAKRSSGAQHQVRRAHVIRAPGHSVTLFPGEFIEAEVPEIISNTTVALEPRADNTHPEWPKPHVTKSIEGIIRVPNLTPEPMTLKRHEHIGQVWPVYTPPKLKQTESPDIYIAITKAKTNNNRHSATVTVDPDSILPLDNRKQMQDILSEFDTVFSKNYEGYNGAAGPFKAEVNMGPTKPPQRKGRLPQYAKNKLVELQDKFDELEQAGVFAKPEDVGISVEYVNPSFLIAKPSGGYRLVTAFADVGRYSKPQPSLMPDVDSTLRHIAQWKYLCTTDLSNAFYQIPLDTDSMKYCGIVTPYKGTRVYTRCAMGMPGSESALEELMCRVLGDLLQEGIVTKLADDLYCGANSPEELARNWKRVLQALHRCGLCLSPTKTIIAPKKTTILGWVWESGTIRANPHRISSLAMCPPPKTVKEMRSFVGAYKVLARVLPGCSALLASLDDATAGKQSQERISWSDELHCSFQKAQMALQTNRTIVLPRVDDQLWIVTDAGIRDHSIGATMYANRQGKLKLAGFFSAKLQKRQTLWLPCEVEALAIAIAVKHFSPFLVQSNHKACILTDSKPCVQAYEKLCRGEFSVSPRVSTFLSAVSRYQGSVQHLAGAANLPSDHASRNAPECNETACQVCGFIKRTEMSVVVRGIDINEIVDGKVRLPFLSRQAWATIQSECPDLRRTHAHLSQGTRPSKKLTNIRDVKRYLNIASIAHDGLLVARKEQPLSTHQDRIIIPRHVLEGLLTAMHIQLDHPTQYQMKKAVSRYLYALDLDKAIENVTESCHPCTSLKQIPRTPIQQSSCDPPEGVGISFAADILKYDRQCILVLRECVTSYTTSRIVPSEKHGDLRDALICLCCELNPLQGPLAVIRVDPAPGFQALRDDPLLQKHHIQLEIGRIKNINHNPVAEKAIQELEAELIRQVSRTEKITPRLLATTTARLNTRIRNNGMSAREMWFQRDQYSNEQIPFNDRERIIDQHMKRQENHRHSERSKCPQPAKVVQQEINVGDIIYLYADKSKLQARPRYLVVSKDRQWCMVRKFIGNTLRETPYKVKCSECYKVLSDLITPKPAVHHSDDEEDVIQTGPITTPKVAPTVHEHPEIPAEIIDLPSANGPMPPEQLAQEPDREPVERVADPVDVHANPEDNVSEKSEDEEPLIRQSNRVKRLPAYLEDYTQT